MKNKSRILIVDDEPSIRRILQVAFEKVGYVPLVAEDAETGDLHCQERRVGLRRHRRDYAGPQRLRSA